MEITITKGRLLDQIAIARVDGSSAATTFPHKGPVPHDAVHWYVERELELLQGFWGMVAGGQHPEEIAAIAKAAGHASAKRAEVPDLAIVQLLQAERVVECFEADLWGGASGAAADLIALAETACGTSHVLLPALDAAAVERIRAGLGQFARDWIAAPQGYAAVLEWEEA